jgi:hypothetical protein
MDLCKSQFSQDIFHIAKSIEIHRIISMIKQITDMTTDEIKEILRVIRAEFRYYPNDITPDIKKAFKVKAAPYIEEINKRLYALWIKNGAEAVSKHPIKLSFTTLIQRGI